MKKLELHYVDRAFKEGLAKNVTVVGRTDKEWYFTFEVEGLNEKGTDTYALEKQRGDIRTWADPRILFKFLYNRYGIKAGIFKLEETEHADSKEEEGD